MAKESEFVLLSNFIFLRYYRQKKEVTNRYLLMPDLPLSPMFPRQIWQYHHERK